MERIGIYGGTFNPPHVGHLRAARFALETLGLDRLWLIPDRIAPHKELPPASPSPEQRLEMLALACRGNPGMAVSNVELHREGPSYTYETVTQFHRAYPQAELFLLMGTDMFLTLPQWRHPEQIWEQASLAVLCRGQADEKQAAQKKALEALGARVFLLENPVTALSSTDVRRMCVFQCADPLLPPGVWEYIRAHGLYGTRREYRNLPMEDLEQVVVGLLNPNRVAHVLSCRDVAGELARRYGADETDAARAGLLHDITKALDGSLQLTLCREYGEPLDAFSQKNPKTLHALTGSLVAERIFGENPAVVSAIRSHTTGKAKMTLLEKIIYVADYVEPNRNFPGVERLRALAYRNIDEALMLGLEMTLEMLKSQNREISPESQAALADLKAQGVGTPSEKG